MTAGEPTYEDGMALARRMATERDERFGQLKTAERERDRFAVALREIESVAGRFMQRGHSGFEYEEISEALAVALQELSVIRRKADRAMGRTRKAR